LLKETRRNARTGLAPKNRKDIIMFETLKNRIASWQKYSRTVTELEALSNRELADLGFGRSDIRTIARQAAR
jgi:uncharacterized protein YjiS (DUF1127 family)